MKNNRRPILVTGSTRSGSTWVGQMIAKSPSLGYIHEPFNIKQISGICGGQFKYWFTYVCDSNAPQHYEYIRKCFTFEYPLADKLKAVRNPKNLARLSINYGRFSINRVLRKRPLVKDPLAVFSAEWLARTFDMDVIVLIRHPAAFAGSLKHANWPHPFHHFLNQPLLMRDHLADYAAEIEAFSANEQDIIDQAVLLWNIIHATIFKYKNSQPDWYFVRHEDISLNPVAEFRKIYRELDLNYEQSIQDEIQRFSRSGDQENPEDIMSIKRDSQATIWNWKDRLTVEEIERVKSGTQEVGRHFYGDEDW